MAKKTACNCAASHGGTCTPAMVAHRRPEEIAAEYGRVCAELGDAYYRQHVGIPTAIEALLERAAALNLEASEAQKATTNQESPSNG